MYLKKTSILFAATSFFIYSNLGYIHIKSWIHLAQGGWGGNPLLKGWGARRIFKGFRSSFGSS